MGEIGPCELVEGRLIMMTPAGGRHGTVTMTIGGILRSFVAEHRLGVVCAAETGFLIARDPDTVRAPDVAFIDRGRVPSGGPPESYWPFAPDLAVEVVSPNDRWIQIEERAAAWLRAGVRLVWVANPRACTVHAFHLDGRVQRRSEDEVLTGEDVVPGFAVRVADLFT